MHIEIVIFNGCKYWMHAWVLLMKISSENYIKKLSYIAREELINKCQKHGGKLN